MDAAINSNTSVADYLGMPILRFYEVRQAIMDVYERRASVQKAHVPNKGKAYRRRR